MGRTLVVGDVHGCRDELDELLERVAFTESDRLYFVGDLVTRGPDPAGVLEIVRQTRGRAVRGNHEDRLLEYRTALRDGTTPPHLGGSQRATLLQLGDEDWELMQSFPFWLDVAEHDLRIVHAGVLPGVPIEKQPPQVLLTMRCLGPHGEPEEASGGTLWGTRYVGPPHVVFGHNAKEEVQLHPWATGIDTGAVYGRCLTALVLEAGERVPPVEEREHALVAVRSRRCYFEARVRA